MKRPIVFAAFALAVFVTGPAAAQVVPGAPAGHATTTVPTATPGIALTAPPCAPSLPSPVARADLLGSLSWLNVDTEGADAYDDWYNRGLYGALAAGWYWTDHLKTEVEVAASTDAEVYGTRQVVVDRYVGYGSSELTFSTTRISLAQQYQFFRNAWFHPFVAAGAALVWETSSARHDPVFVFDPQTRQTRQALPPTVEGPETTVNVRPFADLGFKAYLTPRAFFRSDLRLVFGGGPDEVMVRFGIGVDVLR